MIRHTRSLVLTLAATLLFLAGCAGSKKAVTVGTEAGVSPSAYTEGVVAQVASGPSILTLGTFDNGNAAYNADASKLVFQSNRDGHWQIYQWTRSDTAVARLHSSDYNDESPVYTTDGTGLLFVSDRNCEGKEYQGDIFLLDVAASSVATLIQNPGDDWYPVPCDAASFLFLSDRGETDPLNFDMPRTSLFKGYLDGRPAEQLVGVDLNVCSPALVDPSRCLVRTASAEIGSLDLTSKVVSVLSSSDLHIGSIDYSPVRSIACVTILQGSSYKLALVNPASNIIQTVETGEGEVRSPRFSADGLHVVFTQHVDGNFQLFELILAQ